MRELPILKSCCYYVPLRIGLAVIEIAKMIILASVTIYGIKNYCGNYRTECYNGSALDLLFGLFLFLVGIDFLFTFMMLTGVYLRHAKLLIISCYYTIVTMAICSLIWGILLACEMFMIGGWILSVLILNIIVSIVCQIIALILLLMFQFYIFLLIRSVIYEVTGEINMKFCGSAAEYQCLIDMERTDKNEVAYGGDVAYQ